MSCNSKHAEVEFIILDEDLKASGWQPSYAKPGDAGMDVIACANVIVPPLSTKLVPLGFAMHLANANMVAFLLPRSGKGHKEGIVLGNLVGVIDSGYQGQMFASVWNRNPDREVNIKMGDHIAQLVVMPIVRVTWHEVESFTPSERGEGGFGSTR
jgi:dUTP pyrophosphatase